MLRVTLLILALTAAALALPMSDLPLEEEAVQESEKYGSTLEDVQVRELIRHGNQAKWGWGNDAVSGLYKYSGTELLVAGTVQLASGVKKLFTGGICGVCKNGIAALFKTAISMGSTAGCVPAATAVGALVAPILGGVDAGALGIATGIITQVKCSEAISAGAGKLPWIGGDNAAFTKGFCTFTSLCDESDFNDKAPKKPVDADKLLSQAKELDAKGKAAAEKVKADAEKDPKAKASFERQLQEARALAEKKAAENKVAATTPAKPAATTAAKSATTTAAKTNPRK